MQHDDNQTTDDEVIDPQVVEVEPDEDDGPLDPDPGRIADVALERLRARRFSFDDERRAMEQALAEDDIYSDDFKKQKYDGFIDSAVAEAEALARRSWNETIAAEEALAEDVARAAQQADAGLDHYAISTYTADYSSRLSVIPPPRGGTERADTLHYISALADEVESTRSPERARAFRIAAAPVVRGLVRATGAGDDDRLARDLNRRIAGMAMAERGGAPRAEKRLAKMRVRRAEVRSEILNLEQAMTGARTNIFAPVTPWAGRILGETMETYGGGVHFKGES